MTGTLMVNPIAIMPMIDPTPKTKIEKSPVTISVVVARIININAADPASPWASPIHSGRIASAIQCRWR